MPPRHIRNRRAPVAATIALVEPDPDEDDDNLDAVAAPDPGRSAWDETLRRREAAVMRRGGGLNVVMSLHWEPAAEIERHHTGRRRWMFRGVAYVDVTDLAVK